MKSKTIKRRLIEALDRPGTRGLLSAITTRYARKITGQDVAVFYDDLWIHRTGNNYLSDSERYAYYEWDALHWEELYQRSQREAVDCWLYRYTPSPGDVIIDVGAGIGTDTIAFSRRVGPNGKVLAIESHPRTFLALQKTTKWNRLSNVICEQVAVMGQPGTVYMDDLPDHEANSVTRSGDDSHKVAVRADTLDALTEKHGLEEIALLKMNIEGAERWALPGMKKTIARSRYVVIACHDFRSERGDKGNFSTKDVVSDFLIKVNFEVSTRDSDPRPYVRDHVHGVRYHLRMHDSPHTVSTHT
jgi:FkbM family methyltransferase